MNGTDASEARLLLEVSSEPARAVLNGDWVIRRLGEAERDVAYAAWPGSGSLVIDGTGLGRLDTAGAWLLVRLAGELEVRGVRVGWEGFGDNESALLRLSRAGTGGQPPQRTAGPPNVLENTGRFTVGQILALAGFLGFVGDAFLSLLRCVVRPRRWRGGQLVGHMYTGGLLAVPIAGLLSFMMGVVIAYQGAVLLEWYGADLFTVDLVGLSVVRELAPLLTAIIVAGRTGSAYTAQLGTMSVTEEVDALRTIGVGPMEYLVLPRLLALILVLPLLTVFCDLTGVLGGLLMTQAKLGIGIHAFVSRLEYALTFKSFTLGLVKTPVFAAIIALIGCYQGFLVRGGAQSVGRHTTVCVVQSLFLVILADAAFSIYYSWLGL